MILCGHGLWRRDWGLRHFDDFDVVACFFQANSDIYLDNRQTVHWTQQHKIQLFLSCFVRRTGFDLPHHEVQWEFCRLARYQLQRHPSTRLPNSLEILSPSLIQTIQSIKVISLTHWKMWLFVNYPRRNCRSMLLLNRPNLARRLQRRRQHGWRLCCQACMSLAS